MKRNHPPPPVLAFVSLVVLLLQFVSVSSSSSPLCLEEERTLLIQLKKEFFIHNRPGLHSKLDSWSAAIAKEVDCCLWEGVTCDQHTGHVIGLDLSSSSISGGSGSNKSSLFGLTHLHRLDLSNNMFDSPVPQVGGFCKLLNLSHLNLSESSFPISSGEISLMRELVSLDLSRNRHMQILDPKIIIQNLTTNLEELILSEIDLSSFGSEWSQIISSSLPNLRILSLNDCYLVGPIHHSFTRRLRFLTHLYLSNNQNILGPVPNFLANLTYLTVLQMSNCNLMGKFPDPIFLMPSLTDLVLSGNEMLKGSLPTFPNSSRLETIDLSHTGFSGNLLSLSNHLPFLKDLNLAFSNFSGSILTSFEYSTELLHLRLYSNHFSGHLPWLTRSKKLQTLDLQDNKFTGTIPPLSLKNLQYLNLRENFLEGTIPSSLFTFPSLRIFDLANNLLHGQLQEFRSSLLERIDLSENELHGPIPRSIFNLPSVESISLSDNNFSGTLDPHLYISCKNLSNLNLSNNKLTGVIPNWVWELGNKKLENLNLAVNMLSGFEKPGPNLESSFLVSLNLSSNSLQGYFPNSPPSIQFLDYSNNKFTSELPSNFFSLAQNAIFVSLSDNSMVGEIPASICEATHLQILDLSHNHFKGSIPSCLNLSYPFEVINLSNNKLTGLVPQIFGEDCVLRSLSLNQNDLEGPLPNSLANCKYYMEVLDLANNHFNGTFPMWLGGFENLRVLVLRSNNFGGSLEPPRDNAFSLLQIFDISSNNFKGHLPAKMFHMWKAMMNVTELGSYSGFLHSRFVDGYEGYYQDRVTIIGKGQEQGIEKISAIHVAIDVSNNQFEGEIPAVIGKLEALYILNMSRNHFRGSIPSSFGELKQLLSLDLSQNQLSGNIPMQLATLTFLSTLKLSRNQLVGAIPRGSQFSTFNAESFEGNIGLCGLPLTKTCGSKALSPPVVQVEDEDGEFIDESFWNAFGIGNAVGVVIGLFVGHIIGNYFIRERNRRKKIARKPIRPLRRW